MFSRILHEIYPCTHDNSNLNKLSALFFLAQRRNEKEGTNK